MKNRTKIITTMLAVVILVLYMINFVIYKAVVLTFGITEPSFLLIGILGILGFSVIASLILGMTRYNFFTRVYYLISMVWLGFIGYFFIASVIYILISVFAGSRLETLGVTLLGLSLLAGIYGVAHARNFVIKEITVKLSNLPEAWRGRKAVWVSDLHLGQIYGKNFMKKVIRKIKSISPDIVFIGGDLFDGSSVQGILESASPLRELSAPLGVYFITGNHEQFGDETKFLNAVKSANISILQDKMTEIEGMQIIGADYRNTTDKPKFEKILSGLSIDMNKPSILLKHEPRNIDVAEKAGISLQISGHTHEAQQWPFGYLARMAYGRFSYGLSKMNNLQVYTSSGTGTWGPSIRIGTDSEIVVFTFE